MKSRAALVAAGIAVLLLAWLAAAVIGTRGIDRGLAAEPMYGWANGMAGVTCEPERVTVRLGADAMRRYDLVGQFCQGSDREHPTLQVLVPGAGYGAAYWDFPFQPDVFSYARSALRAGDAVFSFDRLGTGLSDHPFGALLDVDAQAYVLHQLITALADRHDVGPVVAIGHSFGSTIALAHALQWPDQVGGVVLTGFIHNVNPAFGPTVGRDLRVAAFSGPLAGRLFDPTYVISRPGSRGAVFYASGHVDPEVLRVDDATRETTTVGEILSMRRYFGPQSRSLAVPVLVVVGEEDFVVCGGALDCTDHAAVAAREAAFYPAAACPEVRVLDDTGHNLNLHRSAPASFALIQDWIKRRVGAAGAPPSEPCSGT